MEYSLLIIGITVLALPFYTGVSYFILKYLGVTDYLLKRAFKFGGIILLIHFTSSILFSLIGIPLLGSVVGLVGSFYYVNTVLKISTFRNIAIILALPISASVVMGIVSLPLLAKLVKKNNKLLNRKNYSLSLVW